MYEYITSVKIYCVFVNYTSIDAKKKMSELDISSTCTSITHEYNLQSQVLSAHHFVSMELEP